MLNQSTTVSGPVPRVAILHKRAFVEANCQAITKQAIICPARLITKPRSGRSLTHHTNKQRSPSRASVAVCADASQLSARANDTTTPPPDLTQALAVAGFLAVRYGSFSIDAHLILKGLAALQLLVAAVALVTRGVHTDRVSGVIGPCALALYALNYSRIPFLTAITALFGYNLSEQLPGPYYIWAVTLAGALYYGYGSYWYTAGVALMAVWNFFKRGGTVNAVASLATVAVSAYVAYHEATTLWVMILVSAQILWSGVRTVLAGVNLAQ